MARNLYRFYLYAVSIALLSFAAFALGRLLQTLLNLTPLRDSYTSAPSSADVVQSVVFFVVSWLIVGLLGGFHYWLIRRDIQSDATASASLIRSFFLNIIEAIVIAIGVPVFGFAVIQQFGQGNSGAIFASAYAIPLLFMFTLLELERRRSPSAAETTSLFHRLHFYGVQILFLIYLTISLLNALRPLVDAVLFGGRGRLASCTLGPDTYCPNYNLFALALSILWFLGFWAWYGWLLRRDASNPLRFILHFASFGYGVGFILYGIQRAISLLIAPLFHINFSLKDVTGVYANYDFFSPLVLGTLVLLGYHFLVRAGSQEGLLEQKFIRPIESAAAAVVSAVTFWVGWSYLLYDFLQKLNPVPNAPDNENWIFALALIVAGLGYIPLDFYLYRSNKTTPDSGAGARRGFVLAVLGAGLLAFAIGGATALYSWITAAFGSSFTNWQQTVHVGLAVAVVGAVVVAFYLMVALREKLFSGFAQQPTPPVTPTPTDSVPANTKVEDILDELLAGKLTRDEAAKRIYALTL